VSVRRRSGRSLLLSGPKWSQLSRIGDSHLGDHVEGQAVVEPIAERPHMPEYGVDTDRWEALPWSWASERLRRSRNLWVVTVSASGRPHALPVWGVWSDDVPGCMFSCAPSARKAANIAANPQVCVMVDDTVEVVSVEGTARLLTDDADLDLWTEPYQAKYVDADITADWLRQNSVFEVTPQQAFGIVERGDAFSDRATRWRFP
jgi:hypothetical protein